VNDQQTWFLCLAILLAGERNLIAVAALVAGMFIFFPQDIIHALQAVGIAS
jgi:hypothetical protein